MNNEIWKQLKINNIKEDFYAISSYGRIKYLNDEFDEVDFNKHLYISSNGYNYYQFISNDNASKMVVFPIDELVAETFIPIDESFVGKNITVEHINGNTRNSFVDNLKWIEEPEIWKPVILEALDPEKYEVSNFGGIRHTRTGHVSYKTKVNSRGYCSFIYTGTDGKQHNTTKHKIVALEFVPGYDAQYANEVNHINGVKTNNYWKNLEWVDHDSNMKHAFSNMMVNPVHGENVHLSNMTNYEATLIASLLVNCWGKSTTVHDIIKKMGFDDITLKQIQHIKNKADWVWLTDNFWTKDVLQKLSIAKIHLISVSLAHFKGDVDSTYNAVTTIIPGITKRFIQGIKYKEYYNDISDKYFTKDQFK